MSGCTPVLEKLATDRRDRRSNLVTFLLSMMYHLRPAAISKPFRDSTSLSPVYRKDLTSSRSYQLRLLWNLFAVLNSLLTKYAYVGPTKKRTKNLLSSTRQLFSLLCNVQSGEEDDIQVGSLMHILGRPHLRHRKNLQG